MGAAREPMVDPVRGRKPGPPELRVVKGDKRVRGLQAAQPVPSLPDEPTPAPEWDAAHRAKWDEVADLLRRQGTLGAEVGDVLRLYVEACIEAARARAHVREHGAIVPAPRTGVPMHSPHRAVARQAEATMLKLAAELGMTPSSRSRIAKPAGQGNNPFAGHGRRA